MEIRFCTVCNESIPDGEFDSGRAIVSGTKSLHVACALRRSVQMNGIRSWLTFGLALFAAAGTTFLFFSTFKRQEKPAEVTEVPPVVEERLLAEVQQSEARMAALDRRGLAAVRKDLAADFEKKLKEAWEVRVGDDLRALGERIQDGDTALHDRLSALDRRMSNAEEGVDKLLDWLKAIERQAQLQQKELEQLRNAPPPAVEPPAVAEAEQPVTPDPEPEKPDARREAEIDRWIKRLKDANEDIVFSATIELARLKALRATPDLVRVLQKHRDFYARLGAATALGEIESAGAVPALIEALDDRDDLVRTAASEALHRITQEDFNFVSGLDRAQRSKIQRKWQSWWRENEDALRRRLKQPAAGG